MRKNPGDVNMSNRKSLDSVIRVLQRNSAIRRHIWGQGGVLSGFIVMSKPHSDRGRQVPGICSCQAADPAGTSAVAPRFRYALRSSVESQCVRPQ